MVEERLVVVVVYDVCTFATVIQYMLSFLFGDGKVFFCSVMSAFLVFQHAEREDLLHAFLSRGIFLKKNDNFALFCILHPYFFFFPRPSLPPCLST